MILVTGATGAVGGELIKQLLGHDIQLRAITRNPDTAKLPAEVEVHYGDLDAAESLAEPLRDADAIFLINSGDTDGVVAAIARSGVRRVVFLSALAASTRPESPIGAGHLETERKLAGLDVELTILRPGAFASNTFSWRPMIQAGTVYAPFADVATPFIDPYDIASTAAVMLLADSAEHAGKVYELTGPESLNPPQRVAVLADVLQRPIRFAEQTRDQAREQLLRQLPPAVVDAVLDLFGNANERERSVLPTVPELTGRPGTTFADWVRRNAGALA